MVATSDSRTNSDSRANASTSFDAGPDPRLDGAGDGHSYARPDTGANPRPSTEAAEA
jgi:hypothetical protein